MAPPPGTAPDWFLQPAAGYDVTLQATVDGRVAAEATARRQKPVRGRRGRAAAAAGQGRDLREPVPAQAPRDSAPGYAGLRRLRRGLTTSFAAALLAAHGHPSLALAYFKAPGLPQTVHNLPLEYFTRALKLLRARRSSGNPTRRGRRRRSSR